MSCQEKLVSVCSVWDREENNPNTGYVLANLERFLKRWKPWLSVKNAHLQKFVAPSGTGYGRVPWRPPVTTCQEVIWSAVLEEVQKDAEAGTAPWFQFTFEIDSLRYWLNYRRFIDVFIDLFLEFIFIEIHAWSKKWSMMKNSEEARLGGFCGMLSCCLIFFDWNPFP